MITRADIGTALYWLLGAAVLAGLYLVFQESFFFFFKARALKRSLGPSIRREKELPPAVRALGDLASSSLNRDISPMGMLWFLGTLFFAVFAFAVRSFRLFPALLIAALAASFPIILLAAGLSGQQSKSSREGIALATELNRRYRMENRNIYQALELLVASDGDFPICRKHVYRLLLHLRASASPREIRAACDSFAFALGTVWGSMLATCIRVSAEKGSDISEGLADIVLQLKNANRRSEERKRLNSEAARMTVWLVPLLYAATMGLAVGYLNMSLSDLMKNQFFTREGVMFFMLILFLFLFNRVILKLVDSQKLDY